MASILDLLPPKDAVTLRGIEIEVRSLTALDFAILLQTYPQVRAFVDGTWNRARMTGVEAQKLLTEMPDAVHEIIARGMADQSAGHEALLAAAAKQAVADQMTLLLAIMKATMPEGPGPFADAVVALLAGSWGGPTKIAPMTEDKSDGEGSPTSSPARLSASLLLDTPKHRLGELRLAS